MANYPVNRTNWTVTIPEATPTVAGLLSADDKADIDASAPLKVGTITQNSPIRLVNANFSLLAATGKQNYFQSYFNDGTVPVTAAAPSGYTILGPAVIQPGTSGSFALYSFANTFRRWS